MGNTGTGPAGAVGTGGAATGNGATGGNGRTGYHNPYAPRGNRNVNAGYGAANGYPWYPFSYGWNPGWYGNGYGNGYNTVPYGYNGFSDNGNGNNTDNVGTNTGTTNTPTGGLVTAPAAGTQAQTAAGAHAQLENAVDKSPALTTANSAVSMAQSSYDQNRERVIADLAKKPEYQDAVKRRRDAAGKVAAAKAVDTPGQTPPANTPVPIDVVAAAQAKLDAGDEVTKMEERAVAADPAAAVAKARLEQAQTDRDALHNQMLAQPVGR